MTPALLGVELNDSVLKALKASRCAGVFFVWNRAHGYIRFLYDLERSCL